MKIKLNESILYSSKGKLNIIFVKTDERLFSNVLSMIDKKIQSGIFSRFKNLDQIKSSISGYYLEEQDIESD